MTHIQQRRDLAAVWTSVNPVLFDGEEGHEKDTGKYKMGDGVTAWVDLPYKPGVESVNGQTGHVTGLAPLASPTFTGDPKVPTPAASDNDTSIANTAFVKAAIAALVDSSPTTLDTLNELAAALGDDPNFATTMTNALAAKAPLASPALTGNPTAPTPAVNDSDTSIATTAMVNQRPHLKVRTTTAQAVAANSAVPYNTVIEDTHAGWDAGAFAYAVPFAGIYRVTFQFKWGSAPAGLPLHHVRVSGTNKTSPPNTALTAFAGENYTYELRVPTAGQIQIYCATNGYTMQSDGDVDNNFLVIDWVRP